MRLEIGRNSVLALKKENINIPNILSFTRIIIIIPFMLYFLSDDYLLSATMLALSGLSDMLDGFIARKLNQITKLGKILDPVADKLTLTSVVVCMGIKFPEISVFAVILIVKDLSMLLAGSYQLKKGIEPPAAKWYGKLATVFFYVSVIIVVALKAVYGITNLMISVSLLTVTSILMLFAVFKYLLIFLKLINEKNEKEKGHVQINK